MKIRTGFVSNSSSSAFILQKEDLTEDQIKKILNYKGEDHWVFFELNDKLLGSAIMDNGDMEEFFKKIKIPEDKIDIKDTDHNSMDKDCTKKDWKSFIEYLS